MTATTTPKALPILIGAAVTMSLAMGMRQCLGLFLPPVTHGLGLTAADFTFAIAVQNIAWGSCRLLLGHLPTNMASAQRSSAAFCSTSQRWS